MRVLILTLGSRGDVQPYVALGAAIGGLGHQVTLSTGVGFEDLIEAQGLTAAPLSIDFRALVERPDVRRALRSWPAMARLWRSSKDLIRRPLEEMWQIARDLGPDLIVFHPKALAAPHIAEALGIPAIPAAVIPGFVPTSTYPSPLLPFPNLGSFGNRLSHSLLLRLMRSAYGSTVQGWRRGQLGLEGPGPRDPFGAIDPACRQLVRLHGYSRHLVPRPADWEPRDVVTGYWFSETDPNWAPPQDLLRFLKAGPPPVYVGFGSMPSEPGSLTPGVVEALASAGQRGILSIGWDGLEPGAASDRIHVLHSAPHAWLFPRCAAVVHHGGAGTTHEALRWGRPSIVCPVFGDQPFWARRIARLGAGPEPLPQRRLTAPALARAIDAALEPRVVARAGELGAALREEPGAGGAAEAVDRVMA